MRKPAGIIPKPTQCESHGLAPCGPCLTQLRHPVANVAIGRGRQQSDPRSSSQAPVPTHRPPRPKLGRAGVRQAQASKAKSRRTNRRSTMETLQQAPRLLPTRRVQPVSRQLRIRIRLNAPSSDIGLSKGSGQASLHAFRSQARHWAPGLKRRATLPPAAPHQTPASHSAGSHHPRRGHHTPAPAGSSAYADHRPSCPPRPGPSRRSRARRPAGS